MVAQNPSSNDEAFEQQCIKQYGDKWPEIKARWEEDRRRSALASEAYDGESGLSSLEGALGLLPQGDVASRIDAVIFAVERKIQKWEQTPPNGLKRDHELISKLFSATDKAEVSRYVGGGYLPDCWWARLAIELDRRRLYDRLTAQIHRETMAQMAEDHLADERSFGGKIKAAKSPTAAAKAAAKQLWPSANKKGWSAIRLHSELSALGHTVAPDTVRKWVTKLRQTGTC